MMARWRDASMGFLFLCTGVITNVGYAVYPPPKNSEVGVYFLINIALDEMVV
jgi:hypothetical protein